MYYNLNEKKILITGGAGFIGREVFRLLRDSHPKTQLRFFDIYPVNSPDMNGVSGSVLDRTSLRNAMNGVGYVIHLAAWLGVEASDRQPLKCLDINIEGTLNVIEAAVMANVAKIVFASSSEVYGNANALPITEDTPLNPKSVYAVAKLAGEEYMRAYSEQYGVSYSIIRFFNIYGPRQDLRFAIPKFVKSAIDGKAPKIFGDGNQTRAFCHVSDAALGVIRALRHKEADGEIINIGNPDCYTTIIDLWRSVARLAGQDIEPNMCSFSAETRTESREIARRCPSIEKATRLIGYTPKIALDSGLSTVIDYRRRVGWSQNGA